MKSMMKDLKGIWHLKVCPCHSAWTCPIPSTAGQAKVAKASSLKGVSKWILYRFIPSKHVYSFPNCHTIAERSSHFSLPNLVEAKGPV